MMSKFIVQLLLSVTLSVGAVVGFRSDVRGELKATLREARGVAGKTVEAVLETTNDLKMRAAASIAAKFDGRNSARGDVTQDIQTRGDPELFGGNSLFEGFIPPLSTDAEFGTKTRSNARVEPGSTELELKNRLKSDLDLELGLDD